MVDVRVGRGVSVGVGMGVAVTITGVAGTSVFLTGVDWGIVEIKVGTIVGGTTTEADRQPSRLTGRSRVNVVNTINRFMVIYILGYGM